MFFQNVQWSSSYVTVIHCVNFYNCSNFPFVIVCLKIELLRHKYKSGDDCCFLVWLLAVMGLSLGWPYVPFSPGQSRF